VLVSSGRAREVQMPAAIQPNSAETPFSHFRSISIFNEVRFDKMFKSTL